jgi:hypothetical protein
MNAFIGYARGQAAKYSLKGERLNRLREFYEIIERVAGECGDTPLVRVWNQLPKDDERINANGIKELQIAGKWFGATTRTGLVEIALSNLIDRYGKRAKASADANGADWKALSHAVRVSKELIEILSFGRINFPLKDASLLLSIKKGELTMEEVQNILDRDLAFIEVQTHQSHLPDKVDHKWWDDFLMNIMLEYIND